jgi:hypothetical protein
LKDQEVENADISGWPLPDEWLLELGRLTAIWSTLESGINVYLAKLAGFNDVTDSRPFILLKHSSFQQKLDILGSLCELLARRHPRLAHYQDVVAALNRAKTARNRFVHDSIMPNDYGEMELASASARGKLKVEVRIVRLVELKRATMEVHLATLALHKLTTDVEYPPIWTSRRNAKLDEKRARRHNRDTPDGDVPI